VSCMGLYQTYASHWQLRWKKCSGCSSSHKLGEPSAQAVLKPQIREMQARIPGRNLNYKQMPYTQTILSNWQ
jgi:hypothetical protein